VIEKIPFVSVFLLPEPIFSQLLSVLKRPVFRLGMWKFG